MPRYRGKLYRLAGADMVYPDAVRSEEDIKRFVDEVGGLISINMGFGIRARPTTPLLPVKRLAELGVARVSLARMLPAAAIAAMGKALDVMLDSVRTGITHDRPDLLASIDEITDLMGYESINSLEAQFTLPEDIDRRYGAGLRDHVVRSEKPTTSER